MNRYLFSLAASVVLATPVHGASLAMPFPQHTEYTHGTIKPSNHSQADLDSATLAFYNVWKKRYLRSAAPGQLYVFCNADKRFDEPDTRSVSEGHGYGMVATVLMAGADPEAQTNFDALYRFFRSHPTAQHHDLMSWRQICRRGSTKLVEGHEDDDSATDGDLDIAYSLLLADKQWGSQGEIDYKAEAGKVMAAILAGETDAARDTLTLGDWEDDESPMWGSLRSSDFMPVYLKRFAAVSNDKRWTAITDHTYAIFTGLISNFSPNTALLPDFIVLKNGQYAPAPPHFLEGKDDGNYAYNACRYPWRIGLDYLLNGDKRALQMLQRLNQWIVKAADGDPEKVNAGYRLDGKPLKEDDSAAFIGPFAVAAMAEPQNQEWLNALWNDLLQRKPNKEGYYGNSVKLLTMIVVSGNWW